MRRSLFDNVQERTNNDSKVLEKLKSKKTVTTAKRGGGGALDRIKAIIDNVTANLGKFADETLIIRDEATLSEYIDKCVTSGKVAIDTETTGLNPITDKVVGVGLYTPDDKAAYIPVEHVNYITLEKVEQLSPEVVGKHLSKLSKCTEIVEHNAKFDTRFIRHSFGVNLVCTWDTYLASMLLDENEDTHALKPQHRDHVLNGVGDAFKYDALFKDVDYRQIPVKVASLYAAHDPKITWELKEWQEKYLYWDSTQDKTARDGMNGVAWVFFNIEMPSVQVFADLEDVGMCFDFDYHRNLQPQYHEKLEKAELELQRLIEPYEQQIRQSGLEYPVNLNSPKQLDSLLYDIMGYTLVDDKTGQPIRGTSEACLLKIDTPFTKALLEYRGLSKLVSTYIDKMPNCVLEDGRVHCNFNQYGALTGRVSSDNPNMQNIPSHNKDIRKMFVATNGYLLMSSDFSQQEPKCLAALCKQGGDSQMYDTFMVGKDLYSEIASKAFNKSYDECREFADDGSKNPPEYKERRTQAKSILLGALYGRGEGSIAEQLHTTLEKAKQIKQSVFRGFPAIKQFEDDSLEMARTRGYVTTVCGRKRRLPALQLPEYEFKWKDGVSPYEDPLDFDNDTSNMPVPLNVQQKWLNQLARCKFGQKRKVFERANVEDHVWIIDNGKAIADATRQCVNARIQGSAADLTKLAMIELHNNQELKELGFRMLIPVHDEVICECPQENIKRCSELLADTMCKAAEKVLEMPIKCDVEASRAWYGESVEV